VASLAFETGSVQMSDGTHEPGRESNSLRAFVRGAWLLLFVQLAVAVLVFGALSAASSRLNAILSETARRQQELTELRRTRDELQQTVNGVRVTLQRARDATLIVREGIIAFHNGRYTEAITQYERALELDADNAYVRDLLSYSQYMAARAALRAGATADAAKYFEAAVTSVRQVLQEIPGYLGGYVELAVYECARNQPDAAVAAYEAALARSPAAGAEFGSRLGEIPQRCSALRQRITAP
jgi:tetratricopeptide (TPR) repeat protein